MISSFSNKSPLALRRPSFAGRGWTERMRSTVVAFMGLMAAGGLALVAIFAQLGFPLLEPVPLPSDPSRANAVAEAEPVAVEPGPATPDRGNRAGFDVGPPVSHAPGAGVPAVDTGGGPGGAVGSPKPEEATGVAAPTGVGPAPDPPRAPAAPADFTPEAPPAAKPTSSPAPAPAPSPPPVEAPVPPPAPPAPAPEVSTAGGPPPHSNAGGNGNGKALGLSK